MSSAVSVWVRVCDICQIWPSAAQTDSKRKRLNTKQTRRRTRNKNQPTFVVSHSFVRTFACAFPVCAVGVRSGGMSVKKKMCRICAREDLHANFVNIFELTVPNVNGGDAGDDKISLFETMRQLTGIKVIVFLIYSCCSMRVRTYQIRATPDTKSEKNIWMLLFGLRLNRFEMFKKNNSKCNSFSSRLLRRFRTATAFRTKCAFRATRKSNSPTEFVPK